MRKITILGLSCAALAASGWIATASAQAPDATPPAAPSTDTAAPPADSAPKPKPMKHHMMKMKPAPKEAGDAAVEDLNAQSLDAAKAGKPFTPSSAAPAPKPPMAKTMMMKHHHHMAMKKAAAAADAPAPDAAPK